MERLMQNLQNLLTIGQRFLNQMTEVERQLYFAAQRHCQELEPLDRTSFLLKMEEE